MDCHDQKNLFRTGATCAGSSIAHDCSRKSSQRIVSGCNDRICRTLYGKEKEAREEDIADAVDYVLTFQEVQDIFDAAGIQPELLSEDEKEHSSRAGRIYARTGGVSEAVKKTVEQIDPDKKSR